MGSLGIIHFAPLELYPPIQNLLNEIAKRNPKAKVFVLTTRTKVNELSRFELTDGKITIVRLGSTLQGRPALVRLIGYVYFYLLSFIYLVARFPDRVLYFETLSSFPAYLYKRFIRRRAKVFIHYHEYTSPEEYQLGMALSRYFHGLEMWLIPKAEWVSHTNEFRMGLFRNSLIPLRGFNEFILPNYPPRSWFQEGKRNRQLPLKIVYVGSLSLSTLYLREFAEWVLEQNGDVIWHIYSYNFTEDARNYLLKLKPEWISMNDGLDYRKLPAVLKDYDVGVVLYKGHIANYIFNAPNKLFEYLACGLDVWFPTIMTGSLPYRTTNVYPGIYSFDFSTLKDLTLADVTNRDHYPANNSHYYCEDALKPLMDAIFG